MDYRQQSFYHNEFIQLGTDYDSVTEVAVYDNRMRQFRDVEEENRLIGDLIGLRPGMSILEIGTGTGAFARYAAQRGASVHAIDISPTMLEYSLLKAQEDQLSSITFEKAGFLSFELRPRVYDAVVTSLALHHLSDVWKCVALDRIHQSLRANGVLVLLDVVFDWKNEQPEAYFERIMEFAPGSKHNFARHIADELSTCSWIMEGILRRAGFAIESDRVEHDFLHVYQCRKVDKP